MFLFYFIWLQIFIEILISNPNEHLKNTNNFLFKFIDIVLPTSMLGDHKISINVFFSYKKRVKESFIFFRANSDLIVLGKVDQQFIVNLILFS